MEIGNPVFRKGFSRDFIHGLSALKSKVLDKNHAIFKAQVKHLVNGNIADNEAYRNCLHEKAKTRCYDETLKALASQKI